MPTGIAAGYAVANPPYALIGSLQNGGKHMKAVAWFCLAGFVHPVAAANAQSAPAPVTKYDGTYAFVSATKVNETSTDYNGRMRPCRDLSPRGPLTIVNGIARYNRQEGSVGPHGDLAMRLIPTPSKAPEGSQAITVGIIDSNGTVRARRVAYRCSHDLIWKKKEK
jgi:hypothetical protein